MSADPAQRLAPAPCSPEEPLNQPNFRPGVWVKTFGCQMNEYDSEKMLLALKDTHRPVENPEEAEVLLINTCSVREKAAHKLYSLLGALRLLKQQHPHMILGVGGCLAQQEGEAILRRSPGVDFVVGTHNLSLIPGLVSRAQRGFKPSVAVDYREEWEELPDEFDFYPQQPASSPYESPVRALIAIQRGCDKRCSFCVVPNTRGPQVSRSMDEILKEIRLKVRLGAREVLLLGQTVNSYGVDLSPRLRFEELIRRVAELDGVRRIRFTSPHPAEVRDSFIKLYEEVPQLCPHIHLPLQSGSDRILRLMNRNYRRDRYLGIVERLRERHAEIAVTTDIIVGFPTETDADFKQTLDVMRKVNYNSSFSFTYSKRPHTVALSAFSESEEIPQALASERLAELQALQDEISRKINAQRVGTQVEVLVEGSNKKISSSMRGRIPENTLVDLSGAQVRPGELVKVLVEQSTPNGLRGRMVARE